MNKSISSINLIKNLIIFLKCIRFNCPYYLYFKIVRILNLEFHPLLLFYHQARIFQRTSCEKWPNRDVEKDALNSDAEEEKHFG